MTTCAGHECQKPVAKLNGKYCSKQCAPYGHFGVQEGTQSPKTRASFYSRGPGETYPPSSVEKKPTAPASVPLNSRRNENLPSASATPLTQKSTTPVTVSGGPTSAPKSAENTTAERPFKEERTVSNTTPVNAAFTTPTEKSSSKEYSAEGNKLTRLTGSTDLSKSSEVEVYLSMSLIDASISDLRNLMTSIAENANKDAVARNVQSVNAACNCAKNIAQLMRLKLDVVKEIRRPVA